MSRSLCIIISIMVTFIFIVGDGMPGFLCRGEWEGRCTLGIGLEWVAVFFDWDHLGSPRGGGTIRTSSSSMCLLGRPSSGLVVD